jgi:hypothetical protein
LLSFPCCDAASSELATTCGPVTCFKRIADPFRPALDSFKLAFGAAAHHFRERFDVVFYHSTILPKPHTFLFEFHHRQDVRAVAGFFFCHAILATPQWVALQDSAQVERMLVEASKRPVFASVLADPATWSTA